MASAAEEAARDAVLDVLDGDCLLSVEGLAAKFFPPNPGFSEKHLHQVIGSLLATGQAHVVDGKIGLVMGSD